MQTLKERIWPDCCYVSSRDQAKSMAKRTITFARVDGYNKRTAANRAIIDRFVDKLLWAIVGISSSRSHSLLKYLIANQFPNCMMSAGITNSNSKCSFRRVEDVVDRLQRISTINHFWIFAGLHQRLRRTRACRTIIPSWINAFASYLNTS